MELVLKVPDILPEGNLPDGNIEFRVYVSRMCSSNFGHVTYLHSGYVILAFRVRSFSLP